MGGHLRRNVCAPHQGFTGEFACSVGQAFVDEMWRLGPNIRNFTDEIECAILL